MPAARYLKRRQIHFRLHGLFCRAKQYDLIPFVNELFCQFGVVIVYNASPPNSAPGQSRLEDVQEDMKSRRTSATFHPR